MAVLLEVVARAGSTGTAGGRRRAPSSWSGRPGRPRGPQATRCRYRSGTKARTSTPGGASRTAGSIRGPGDRDHAQARDPAGGIGIARDDPPEQGLADAGAADRDDDHALVVVIAELPAERLAALDERRRVEAGHVAGEREVALGPVADRAAGPGPKSSGTMSSGSPTKIARSRSRGKRATCSIISAL